jgi:psp operon transcriptional activator
LLESELFGHERGAFTGADTSRRGKFELADGGTLFLDEIAHMSRAFQQKILRVVEYGVFQRVGGVVDLRSTARIVTATNCDLREKIRRGEFLADLYDRLSFEVIEVPPLRQRGIDIELLATHFLEEFARETAINPLRKLSTAALTALREYSFPGNVRELKNIIERAACREGSVEIGTADLALSSEGDLLHGGGSFEEKVDTFCQRLLSEALNQSEGNQAAAARLVGLSYHQFRYYAKKYLGKSGG